jgi:hypothetical protein
MNILDPDVNRYMIELHSATQGDTGVQVSMYEVGSSMGMDKGEAGALAESLIVEGWVELVSLSGAISLTPQGLEVLEVSGSVQGATVVPLQLGSGPVLEKSGSEAVETILSEIKSLFEKKNIPYDSLEEIIIDIKTIELQLLSPRPKLEVVRELLRSLMDVFITLKIDEPQIKLKSLVTS